MGKESNPKKKSERIIAETGMNKACFLFRYAPQKSAMAAIGAKFAG